MKVTNPTPTPILMGDLVHSEKAMPAADLHVLFNATIDAVNRDHAQHLASPLTITLGDEFQGMGTALPPLLAIARDIRFRLMEHGLDCRFVIGLVNLQSPLNPDKAWNMMGPGLGRARRKLDAKKDTSLYQFSLPDHPTIEPLLEALGAGLTTVERGWTDQQRHDIAMLLAGKTPAEIAKRRGVSVHSVYKVRASGHFDAYQMQGRAIEFGLQSLQSETDAP